MQKPILWLLLLTAFLVPAGTAAAQDSGRWQTISEQDGVTISFDTQTLRYADAAGTTIIFWQKNLLTPAAAQEFVTALNLTGDKAHLSYFLEERRIHLANRSSAIDELDLYDTQQTLLETNRIQTPVWESIKPESAGEAVYRAVAAYLTAHPQQIFPAAAQ
jgi:hypothetical protein